MFISIRLAQLYLFCPGLPGAITDRTNAFFLHRRAERLYQDQLCMHHYDHYGRSIITPF